MSAKMLAVGYAASLPITEERSLFEFETPVPDVSGRDLLVRVKAVSVNPIDVKVGMRKQGTPAQPVILGWDAAGIVEAVGPDCPPLRGGRPCLLRRQHQSSRQQLDLPIGGRAHRWPQAQVGRLRASRRPAAHDHHGLGAAVRPHRCQAW